VSVIAQDVNDVVEEVTEDRAPEVLGLKVVDENAQLEELGQMLNQLEDKSSQQTVNQVEKET
jgi:hypothetical protein